MKNGFGRLVNRLEMAKKRLYRLEDMQQKLPKSKIKDKRKYKLKNKTKQKIEENIQDLWDNFKRQNLYVIRILIGKKEKA